VAAGRHSALRLDGFHALNALNQAELLIVAAGRLWIIFLLLGPGIRGPCRLCHYNQRKLTTEN